MPFRAAWLFMWEKTVNGRKTCAGLFPLSEQNKENVTKSFWKRKKYVKNFVPKTIIMNALYEEVTK